MEEIEKFLSEYKCFHIPSERICSCCRKNGFDTTPAFYRYDDTRSIYICDECHTICHRDFIWREEKFKDTEYPDKIVEISRKRGYY